MTRRTRTGLAALGAAALVVLAGCESGDDPPDTPMSSPTTSSASPSSSPTVTPSPSPSSSIPAAAREKTEAGAKAFVQYFFDQINIGWMTPKPGAVSTLSDSACAFCSEVEKTSVDLESKSHRYREVAVTVGQFRKRAGAPAGQFFFEVSVQQHAAAVVDAAGKVVSTDEAGTGASLIGVQWTAEGWRVLEVEVA